MHRLHWECKDYLSQQEEADFVSLYEYNFFLSQFKTDLKCLRREHINHCGWDRAKCFQDWPVLVDWVIMASAEMF